MDHNLGNLPACGWEKVKALGRKARGKGAVKLHLGPVGGKPRVSVGFSQHAADRCLFCLRLNSDIQGCVFVLVYVVLQRAVVAGFWTIRY